MLRKAAFTGGYGVAVSENRFFKAIASSLEEQGFCVVPEFLSREEIDFLVEDFEASPLPSSPLSRAMRQRTPATGETSRWAGRNRARPPMRASRRMNLIFMRKNGCQLSQGVLTAGHPFAFGGINASVAIKGFEPN